VERKILPRRGLARRAGLIWSTGVEFFLILVVVAVGLAAWLGHKAQAARREELARVAVALGMRFAPEERDWGGGLFSTREVLAPFPVFETGHSRSSRNQMEGKLEVWGRSAGVMLADYRYRVTRGAGKSQSTQTYETSFLLLRLPVASPMPTVTLRREGWGDRLAAAVGFEDIDFESEEFSRRFHVSGEDRRFAYNLFDPRMIEFLLEVEPPNLALRGDHVLVTPASGLVKWEPAQFAEAVGWTERFLARWPEFLAKDLLPR
jgi:hypothetical protein